MAKGIHKPTGQKSLYAGFLEPSASYRGKPFWSWNGHLDRDELLRQVQVLKDMGMGGFFMHSRVGLATEYLGQRWFDLINACADDGKRLGLEGWIYDEDRWPSGTAGGMVTENADFRMQFLHLKPVKAETFNWSDPVLAAFACELDGLNFTNCTPITPQTPKAVYAGKTVLVFTVVQMPESTFYNGYTYADTMHRKATDAYIRLTHERYAQQCGDRLGDSIVGIFTDEPHRGPLMNTFSEGSDWSVPWTPSLPDAFKKRFGYDLTDRLPELFLRKNGCKISQVKWHYVDLTEQLFLDNWLRPIYDWCTGHKIQLTGHVLQENSLASQTALLGSVMRAYEYMHAPGIDVLTEGNRDYWVVKQLSSVARQLGRKWLLSELYGVTGWQFNFQSHKNVGDYQALFGINLRCHHLSWYTMEGEAKRDYPASIFYQSAWYKDYRVVETYYARLGYLLSQGRPVCDVLVIHPVESLWCQVYPGWAAHLSAEDPDMQRLEQAFVDVFMWLTGAHIDFDYGDEEMIRRLFRIEKKPDGTVVLYIGQASYRIVLVPPTATLRATTIDLLHQFSEMGGTVIFAGDPPACMDAVPDDAPCKLAEQNVSVAFKKQAIVSACEKKIRPCVEIKDAQGREIETLFCQMRVDDDHTYVAVMNMKPDESHHNVTIRIPAEGTVTEWHCLSGRRHRIPAQSNDGKLEFTADFAPAQEHLFVVFRSDPPSLPLEPMWETESQTELKGPFAYTLSEPNVCVLDLAEYRINDHPWRPLTEVLKIDQAVRDYFGLQRRSNQMIQPWYRRKLMSSPETKGTVTLRFSFVIEAMPRDSVILCIERPEHCRIQLNDAAITSEPLPDWWIDNAIRKIELPPKALKIGANTLELQMPFDESKDIEAVYLIGCFGVHTDGHQNTLTRLPEALSIGCITEQGLPFYSGAVTYHVPMSVSVRENQHVFIETPSFEGACISISVFGQARVLIPWQPYRADITQLLDGADMLDISVVLTRRNTFGPLHLVPSQAPHYGPERWLSDGEQFSMAYQFYPAGLLRPPIQRICRSHPKPSLRG